MRIDKLTLLGALFMLAVAFGVTSPIMKVLLFAVGIALFVLAVGKKKA